MEKYKVEWMCSSVALGGFMQLIASPDYFQQLNKYFSLYFLYFYKPDWFQAMEMDGYITVLPSYYNLSRQFTPCKCTQHTIDTIPPAKQTPIENFSNRIQKSR